MAAATIRTKNNFKPHHGRIRPINRNQFVRDDSDNPPPIAIYIRFDMLFIKPLCWLGDSLEQVRAFAPEARARIGFELWEVQQGNASADWKPVNTIGPGVNEIRVHVKGEYRVSYVAKFTDAVHVLHAFGKKTRKTPNRDIDLAMMRYRELAQAIRRAH